MIIKLVTPYKQILNNIVFAIQGARFAKKSLGKSDSGTLDDNNYYLGEKDLELAINLAKTEVASGHDKFLQQIHFIVDIEMSRYMWQEFDTYRVGISKQSESTMHTLTKDKIDIFNFDILKYSDNEMLVISKYLKNFLKIHNKLKTDLNAGFINDDEFRNILKAILPESFIQKRRVSMNYANVKLINSQRKNHRNVEWKFMLHELEFMLPHSELIF
jgi:hypothetical protein